MDPEQALDELAQDATRLAGGNKAMRAVANRRQVQVHSLRAELRRLNLREAELELQLRKVQQELASHQLRHTMLRHYATAYGARLDVFDQLPATDLPVLEQAAQLCQRIRVRHGVLLPCGTPTGRVLRSPQLLVHQAMAFTRQRLRMQRLGLDPELLTWLRETHGLQSPHAHA